MERFQSTASRDESNAAVNVVGHLKASGERVLHTEQVLQ